METDESKSNDDEVGSYKPAKLETDLEDNDTGESEGSECAESHQVNWPFDAMPSQIITAI